MKQSLTDPDARIADGWGTISAKLNDGSMLHGFARAQGSHDLVLETDDGKLHLLLDSEYKALTPDKHSAMPAYKGTEDELRDLVAFLSGLNRCGRRAADRSRNRRPRQAEIEEIVHPRKGDWPTYNGTLDGNRFSHLDQVNLSNVAKLQLQWTYSIPFNGLETTPVVMDGVMYVTGNNQVYALSGKSGREIWRYVRPKSVAGTIASDAAIGVNRGVAVLGDRIFYLTDDAHLIALHRLTGALLWDVDTAGGRKGSLWWHFGATGCGRSGDHGRERRGQWDSWICRRIQGGNGRARVEVVHDSESRRHWARSRHMEGFGSGSWRRRHMADRQRGH